MHIHVYSAAGNIIGISKYQSPSTSPPPIPPEIDQLLLYSIQKHLVSVSIYNQDLSPAAQCGNGLRALATHLNQPYTFIVNNRSYATIIIGGETWISMQQPINMEALYIGNIPCTLINMGNLHAVFSAQHINLVNNIRTQLPNHNLSFVSFNGAHIYVDTHERGSGWTGSCASACSAVAYIAHKNTNLAYFNCICPDGVLNIYCGSQSIYQTGPVKLIDLLNTS